MKMYLAGQWVDSPEMQTIRSPWNGAAVDDVPNATDAQVQAALAAAVDGARAMAALTGYERQQIMMRAADLLAGRAEEFARTITQEMGKPISAARGAVSRMPDVLRLCAFEGSQLRGETLPLDAQVNTRGKLGMTLRVPCGVVVAITPYNFPLLLVLHKVGPALAAGNAVILKPATTTPLTALKLTEVLIEAGLPALGLQCITGAGSRIGTALCRDARVRKISFTGSVPVGNAITQVAGVKKLSLELGSNAPLIVMQDADLEQVGTLTAMSGFINAGQVCISTQRVFVHRAVYGEVLERLKAEAEAIKIGDPMEDATRLGAMIAEKEAVRVGEWIEEAVADGARVVTGAERERGVFKPTVVADVNLKSRLFREELFGPALGVIPVDNIEQAITLANDSAFGLAAGIFTRDIKAAMRFAREVNCGSLMINWSPLWRADLMPYGGMKDSGIGKEGPRYAIQEMTETKTVVIHGLE